MFGTKLATICGTTDDVCEICGKNTQQTLLKLSDGKAHGFCNDCICREMEASLPPKTPDFLIRYNDGEQRLLKSSLDEVKLALLKAFSERGAVPIEIKNEATEQRYWVKWDCNIFAKGN
jgi:hypothetical protein